MVHGLEGEVIEEEQVDADELAEFAVVAVVEAGRLEPFEEDVGALEADGVAATDDDVAEDGGQ